jgi:hypothetical protein
VDVDTQTTFFKESWSEDKTPTIDWAAEKCFFSVASPFLWRVSKA